MPVGSFIEIVMTSFGWILYDITWDVLASTGIAYIPIISIIFKNIVDPIESQEARSAATTSLRRLEVDLVTMIIIMFMAVAPFFTLSFGAISYTTQCSNSGAQTYNEGSTGTTFDSAFNSSGMLGGRTPTVPPWFYLVMSVAGGINNEMISKLPCELSYRDYYNATSTTNIKDLELKRQAQRFQTECYNPGVADYMNNGKTGAVNEDLGWMGSSYLLDGFYQSSYAANPVKGFAYNPSRESDASHAKTPNGRPSCADWWGAEPNGLRARLVKEYPPNSFFGFFKKRFGVTQTELENDAIKSLLENNNTRAGLSLSGDTQTFDTVLDTITDGAAGGLALVGAGVLDLFMKPVVFMVIKMAPYIQATMLMATYFLLPWILVVGNYSWSTIKTATVTIFAIKFWTTIWAVVSLLDNKLFLSLKGGFNPTNASESIFMMFIVDLIVLALYTSLPFYFLSMLAWGGERGASAAETASSRTGAGAEKAGGKGLSAGDKGLSRISKK